MYNIISFFITILILLFIFFIIKELWWFIVGIILILIALYYGKLIYETIKNKQIEYRTNYTPEMGEVYKVCPYCGTKVKVVEKTCPKCKHDLN